MFIAQHATRDVVTTMTLASRGMMPTSQVVRGEAQPTCKKLSLEAPPRTTALMGPVAEDGPPLYNTAKAEERQAKGKARLAVYRLVDWE